MDNFHCNNERYERPSFISKLHNITRILLLNHQHNICIMITGYVHFIESRFIESHFIELSTYSMNYLA